MEQPRTKTEAKRMAQDEILNHLASLGTLLYERHEYGGWSDEQVREFESVLEQQKERVARLFNYSEFPFVGY